MRALARMQQVSRLLFSALVMALATDTAYAVQIDGKIDPSEWHGAQRVSDFRLTQPLTRSPASQPSEAWLLATPQGLAVAFRNLQSSALPRMRARSQRDEGAAVDRVNLYVDFDGDGRIGYNFRVTLANGIADGTITNENQFNSDWDGDWQHAVSEDDAGWSVEMLIPWHIAPMRGGAEGKRTLGIALDRVLGANGERSSWPAISFLEARYLSDFTKVEVPAYSQSLLALTPYVVGIRDNIAGSQDFDAGADIFWKPSGMFQLSATLNPDFGQVESDQLVVNFGATETFFSDKRAFFTENQSFFDVPFGSLDAANRLIYTRRVGGPTDDHHGAGDVSAALKINGSAAGFNYGALAAAESHDAGRNFYAGRLTRDTERHGIGAMMTLVDRPFLDRQAMVYEFDHRWTPNVAWTVRSTIVGSHVKERMDDIRDLGAQVQVDWDMGDGWRQRVYGLHLGADLALNDFGFLERNSVNYLHYDLGRRFVNSGENSVYRSKDWHLTASRQHNDDGLHLADVLAVSRRGELSDGGEDFLEITAWSPGHDDLISRGNGVVDMPAKLFGYYETFRPQQGQSRWSSFGYARYAADGLGDLNEGQLRLYFEPTYHASDRLSLFGGLQLQHTPEWLLWRPDDDLSTPDNRLGTYRQNMMLLNAGGVWLADERQELRVRLEANGLSARSRRTFRIADDGQPVEVDEELPSFTLRQMGFQIRYRYELAPLSHLYVAYVRGGALLDKEFHGGDATRAFLDAFELRDSEQLLIKLSYRFEI